MERVQTASVIKQLKQQPPLLRTGSSLRLSTSRSANFREPVGKLGSLLASYLSEEPEAIAQYIANHVQYTLARSSSKLDDLGAYQATAFSVRDRLIEFWNDTQQHFEDSKTKMCFYMSIEYLLGRSLENAIMNLELTDQYTAALQKVGFVLEDLYIEEAEAALGNGGLGRLAACFLDSLATMDYPAWGYGIRYEFGMFKQVIVNGQQIETPDFWLLRGNPWEIHRCEISYPVRFYGNVVIVTNDAGELKFIWENGFQLLAVAYDTPIPGYGTLNVINLRLWASRPVLELNLEYFNRGDYYSAVKQRQEAESITSVLYPADTTIEGKELRLKQQYFFACASLHDILARYKRVFPNESLLNFGDYNAIQLNDTHPSISIAELMRILLDEENLGWDDAWNVVTQTFAFTNHTVLPEALERWPLKMFSILLPRHIQIIFEINRRFLDGPVASKWPGDGEKRSDLSIIRDDTVVMAYLAIVGSHSVNGVAAIHTEILKEVIFADFYDLWPHKFNNKTNGVTQRRWVNKANKPLSSLLTSTLKGDDWITNFGCLEKLRAFARDPCFQKQISEVKRQAKVRLRDEILRLTSGRLSLNLDAIFDIHVKRIHEYKRQLLNILGIMHMYLSLKAMFPSQRLSFVPRAFIFAGKAAPSYTRAKLLIQMICCVAEVINNDPSINGLLSVVFIPNYSVSLAEIIIPASDLSQHISTAGTEASGTRNHTWYVGWCKCRDERSHGRRKYVYFWG
eukprot:TRINITY_DN2138_c0_g2_i8.p1 TRINITY_DN2138_c0_g2~~TRINITY_DN2138_c0_g2_i8.p1  ORF type:complete len:770 (+),score=152.30 TRINITY_DN2138_c0_g2_i8:94-2310(+)